MPITSQLHWDLYKQNVDPSQDKSLEIFAIKADAPPLQIDLNHRTLPYKRTCGYGSDDDGPEEELDEDGFMVQENQVFKKVTNKERGPSLFRDVSLANKAVVDCGMRLGLFEPTPCLKVGDTWASDGDENAHLKKGIKRSLQEFKI
ncbi:hypothetical protein D1007_14732 [Hordeum vulgare]|nr:hypothetical protein D1007_14732 [Hordeum vulgare]